MDKSGIAKKSALRLVTSVTFILTITVTVSYWVVYGEKECSILALTAAEKQKRYREKQKLKAAGKLPDPVLPPKLNLPDMSLSAFIRATVEDDEPSAVQELWEDLQKMNLQPLIDGSDPESEIARIESAIEDFMIGLYVLTGVMNDFRKRQIDTELARTTAKDLPNPAKREEALARIVRLTEVRKGLEKKMRIDIPANAIPDD